MNALKEMQVPGEPPNLSPKALRKISNRLIAAQGRLSDVPVRDIAAWIGAAAARWRDLNDPVRREAEGALPQACGLSKEMVREVLDDLFGQLTEAALLGLLESELGDPAVLDRFRPRKGKEGNVRAFGPRLITQILPGNILGVSVVSLVCGLLVKSANLLRVSREELPLIALFATSLKAVWPELGDAVAVLTWDKTREDLTHAAFEKADCAIVYGNNTTLAAVRPHIPVTAKTIFHGHKLSLGVIAREATGVDLAEKAAIDIVLYDQRGCLSPHLYYVESGGAASPHDFAKQLADALRAAAVKWPKGAVSADEAGRIQQLRAALPLKGGAVFQSEKGVDWTVLFDPDPEFTASPLSRTIWIKPVDDLSDIPPLLVPVGDLVQAVGVAASPERAEALANTLSIIGGCRICAIGDMQRPPLHWHHDGAFRLLPLLRFVDWEGE